MCGEHSGQHLDNPGSVFWPLCLDPFWQNPNVMHRRMIVRISNPSFIFTPHRPGRPKRAIATRSSYGKKGSSREDPNQGGPKTTQMLAGRTKNQAFVLPSKPKSRLIQFHFGRTFGHLFLGHFSHRPRPAQKICESSAKRLKSCNNLRRVENT